MASLVLVVSLHSQPFCKHQSQLQDNLPFLWTCYLTQFNLKRQN